MAQDVAQETMWRIWRMACAYDETRGTLLGWVTSIAHNIAVDYARSPAMKLARTIPPAPIPLVLTVEEIAAVTFALDRLHPLEKTVLTLMFYEDLSHNEIARRMQRSLGTIKTWVRSALRNLRNELAPVASKGRAAREFSVADRFGRLNVKRTEELFRRALEHSRKAVAVSNERGEIVMFNSAADTLLGIGSAELDRDKDCSERYGLFRPDGTTPYPVHRLPLWLALAGEHTFGRRVFVRNASVPAGALLIAGASPRFDADRRLIGGILNCSIAPASSGKG
jgi:RNA polymerase sigma-70 factor (ECF subfamily)